MHPLLKQAAGKRAEAQALIEAAGDDGLSAEQLEQVETLTAEATALEAQHGRIERVAALRTANEAAVAGYDRGVGRRTDPEQPDETEAANAEVLGPASRLDPQGGFPTLGHFARDVGAFQSPGGEASEAVRKWAAAGTGMEQGIGSTGGVLVPPAYSKTIWDGVRQKSMSLLDMVDLMTIDPGTESMTFPAIDETSRADGSRWGGLQGYWKAELTQMSESKPTLREVMFTPQELYVLAYVSDKLLRNSPIALDSWLRSKAIDEIDFKVGDAIINGTGAGMPEGVLGSTALVSVAKETGQAAASIVTENIQKMYNAMPGGLRSGAAWLINQDAEPELEGMTLDVGVGGVPVYLPPGGLASAPLGRLRNRPVVPIEYCAALGTVGDVIFANLKMYGAVVKGMVDGQASMHFKFDYAQTAFRFIWEVDGQPWVQSAITAFKGSTERSPFVALATRS